MTASLTTRAATERTPITMAAWGALGACLLAVFLQMLDLTIVNTALPEIAADLAASDAVQLLVVSLYSLTFACTLLTAARLGALLGRRRVFLCALTVFVAASLWCGLSRYGAELIVARGVQGLAAAAMSAQTIAIITASFPPARRALAFGIYGAAAGFAAITGPLAGGVLIAIDPLGVGWHAIFLINVPLGLVGLALAYRFLRQSLSEERERLDLPGALLSTLGLFLVLCPAAIGREKGWPPVLLAMIVGGCALLAVFAARQYRLTRRGGGPLVHAELFTDRGFALGAVLTVGFFGLFGGFLFSVSVAAQSGLGMTAMQTAWLMAPFALGGALGALSSPLLVTRWGPRALTVGMLIYAGAVVGIAVVIGPHAVSVDTVTLSAPVLVAGVGMGCFAAPLPALMLAGVADRITGSASGTVPTLQQLGTSAGVVALGGLFFHRVDEAAPTVTKAATAHAYLTAYTAVLWAVAAAAAALAVVTLAMPRGPAGSDA
ncbi:EmrB/QacA subfamily drug resistance transporter [Nocardia tenerifensis]|uniref:EmrB/QacA subfamily drug resistance transporter n=1 Tax=Nocardia tenerifensis TaxID=228006 RepID=A0A318JRA7_9NOCA|nr:MFS transporter [Nocardia tenerifensis]PXX52169.1 EmrB/QacA subfamily drug resistance transporter [Nocardia tenerifensis]